MLDNIKGFHLELTNMCTLKCPRCARTKFNELFSKFWKNKNLELDHLKTFLDIDISGKHFDLCGNYGDPLYYERLFEAVDFLKNNNAIVTIKTNGSYQTSEWWKELTSRLTNDDSIIFGIDGIPENFTQYRINADWDSILAGIKVASAADVKIVWQYILFSYNQHTVEQAKKLSIELGFDDFYTFRSHRFDGPDDWLTPDESMVDHKSDFKIEWKPLKTQNIEIKPQCKIFNDQHYISADGYYLPCCYAGDHRFYYKSEFYKNKDQYDISKTTLSKVLDNLKDFYNTLEDAKLNYCTFNCPKL